MSLSVLFWLMEAAYLIHCLDETVAGGGFVNMVKKHFWPEYTGKQFFWFNTVLHVINVTAIMLYENFGGAWIIAPLSISWLFVTNGFWHVMGTAMLREYHPGLITSPLYWIVMYLIVRAWLVQNVLPMSYFWISLVIGIVLTIMMIGSLFAMKRRMLVSS